MKIPIEDQAKIKKRLEERNVHPVCPMCGSKKFVFVDGYFTHRIQNHINVVSLDGPSIPAASLICSNCGFIAHHALGVLGLIGGEESGLNEEK